MRMRILLNCIVIYIFTQCIQCEMSGSEKDIKDFMITYRLPNEYSSDVVKEIHRWGNMRYLPLKTSDGQYLDTTEEIVPLECTLATENCKWNMSSGWSYDNWSVTEDDYFTINVDDISPKEKGCAQRNGGCAVFCEMKYGEAMCSCPYGYENYNTSCAYGYYKTSLITKPGIYSGDYNKWLVIPPRNSSTHGNISHKNYHYYRNYNMYLHFKEINSKSNDNFPTITKSMDLRTTINIESKSILEITDNNDIGSFIIVVAYKRQLLTLEENHGWLTHEIKPKSGCICACTIYTSTEQNGTIHLTAQFSNGSTFDIEKFTERQFNKWTLRCFKRLLPKTFNESVQLKMTVSGRKVTLHSIYGCNNQDVLVTRMVTSFPQIQFQENLPGFDTNSTEQCYNGGKFNSTTQKCICPEGYMGDACEEACGPYNVGPNCSRECSSFKWGCRGTIFCKVGLPCLCAPGYKGENCDELCDGSSHGVNCLQECGRCYLGSCDSYTGECEDYSCVPGFHPPLCKSPYVYPKYSPTITDSYINSVTVQLDTDELLGEGNVYLYQLQYKKSEDTEFEGWIELQPRKPGGQIITANISDLSVGTKYNVRVIFINEDGNSYGGELVPQAQFWTPCTVPTSTDYNIEISETVDSIALFLKYTTGKTDCPVTGFTAILQTKEYTVEQNVSSDGFIFFPNLRSGKSYEISVRANTHNGPAPFSTIIVHTKDGVPLRVSNLRAKKNGLGKLLISWESPKFTAGIISKYVIQYRCLTFMGCKGCDESQKEIEVPESQYSVELSGLRYHTQYLIMVAAMSKNISPFSMVFGLTQDAAPDIAPNGVEDSLISSTNSSVTIQWLPVNDCEFLNGYLIGYHYRLLALNNTLLLKGETYHTNITLHNLTPQTLYTIHVFVVSSGGINEDQKLVINATTTATVPDQVQNLTIYKTGRRVLGLRWFQPVNTYGEIESFSISHCQLNNCAMPVTRIVKPEHCVSWPSHFCHTITGVVPNVQYSVSVRTRNDLVDQYGSAATVSATTTEGAPETPISLRVTTRNTNSLILEWKPPRIFNGVLRSFLINVDHIDSSNSTNCCSYIPLREFMINNEEEKYIYEVTDLSPASKYSIGISAKTKYIGPTTSVIVNTPPEMPTLNYFPELIDENVVKITSEGKFPGLVGTYLIIIFPKNGNTRPIFWNPELSEKFHSIIKRNFYVAEEIDAEDLTTSTEIEIGKGISPYNGTISVLEDPELPSNFSVGLALVLEYNGAANVAVVESPEV